MQGIDYYLQNISFATYAAVFVFGVATSFTPCVYPLVPIIAAVIGTSRERSRIWNFLLSLIYVAGMSLTFACLGLLAALAGQMFGSIQTSPVAHFIVGGLIVLFALAFLGYIPLPVFLLNRMGAGKVTHGGNVFSVFIMGAASGLIAAPCATAVLAAILTYVASTKDPVVGFTLLFTYAFGLGVLLILVGTFSGILARLPKSHRVVNFIEKMIGLTMIALGCYFIYKGFIYSI